MPIHFFCLFFNWKTKLHEIWYADDYFLSFRRTYRRGKHTKFQIQNPPYSLHPYKELINWACCMMFGSNLYTKFWGQGPHPSKLTIYSFTYNPEAIWESCIKNFIALSQFCSLMFVLIVFYIKYSYYWKSWNLGCVQKIMKSSEHVVKYSQNVAMD